MSKYLDEDDVIDFTADIKTLSDTTYEPKKLKFTNVTVPTSAFDQNVSDYIVTIRINEQCYDAQNYLVIDDSVFKPKFNSLNLPDGTYTFTIGTWFTITPGSNLKTDEIEYNSTSHTYSVSSWGITINHNSYTPGDIYFYVDQASPHIVSPYNDFPCRAAVALNGVTATTFAEVVFSLADATDDNFAPICDSYAGGIYLYSRSIPSSSITIPSIICFN